MFVSEGDVKGTSDSHIQAFKELKIIILLYWRLRHVPVYRRLFDWCRTDR